METILIARGHSRYPVALPRFLDQSAPASLAALGNLDVLREPKLAFFCSLRCPGSLILQAHDLAKQWREEGRTVVSGFHSPIEQECLRILLRGAQPIIVCPARSLEGMRVHKEFRKPLEEGRLLFLSPFPKREKRMTAGLAAERNCFVAALADEVLIAYASPGGKTEQFCREILNWGKPLLTLESQHNVDLMALGAKPVSPR